MKIKPLSTNEAWQGRRFKSRKYKAFEQEFILKLPAMELPEPPYKLTLDFGFSNKGSDVDNPAKMCIDCLQKKYRFNDNLIYQLILNKNIVAKGEEFINFKFETWNQSCYCP